MNNENELTAALATIEKCREISGCPTGVDLHGWLKQLAAENVGMRETVEAVRGVADKSSGIAGWHLNGEIAKWSEILPEIDDVETPATARIVAGIKAYGVEEFAKHCDDSIGFVEPEDEELYTLMEEQARDFAKQLRDGGCK